MLPSLLTPKPEPLRSIKYKSARARPRRAMLRANESSDSNTAYLAARRTRKELAHGAGRLRLNLAKEESKGQGDFVKLKTLF